MNGEKITPQVPSENPWDSVTESSDNESPHGDELVGEKSHDFIKKAKLGAAALKLSLMQKAHLSDKTVRRNARRMAYDMKYGRLAEDEKMWHKTIDLLAASSDDHDKYIMYTAIPPEILVANDKSFSQIIDDMSRVDEDGNFCYFDGASYLESEHFKAILDNPKRKQTFQEKIVDTGFLGKYIDNAIQYSTYDTSRSDPYQQEKQNNTAKSIELCRQFGIKILDANRDKSITDHIKNVIKVYGKVLTPEDIDEVYLHEMKSFYHYETDSDGIEAILEANLKTSGKNPAVETWAKYSKKLNKNAIAVFDQSIYQLSRENNPAENPEDNLAPFDFSEPEIKKHLFEHTTFKIPDIGNTDTEFYENVRELNPRIIQELAQNDPQIIAALVYGLIDYEPNHTSSSPESIANKIKHIFDNSPETIAKMAEEKDFDKQFSATPIWKLKQYINPNVLSEMGLLEKINQIAEKHPHGLFDPLYSYDDSGDYTPEFCQDNFNKKNMSFFRSLSEEDLSKSGLSESQLAILENLKKYQSSSILYSSEMDALQEKYFDESGNLTPEFWQDSFNRKDTNLLYSLSEENLFKFGLSESQLTILENLKKYQFSSILGYSEMSILQEKYFDESGNLTPEFWQNSIQQGDYNFLKNQEDTLKHAGFSDQDLEAIDIGRAYSDDEEITEKNALTALAVFMRNDMNDWAYANTNDQLIRELFQGAEAKNMALSRLRKFYEQYLYAEDEKQSDFPIVLSVTNRNNTRFDGAGPLTQIESLLNFTTELEKHPEVRKVTAEFEKKIQGRGWTNEDKSNFYNISSEVLAADSEIYQEFINLFNNIVDKKDFDRFTKEIYPLYRAKLTLLKEYDYEGDMIGHGTISSNYSNVNRDELRNQLHNALLPFNLQELSPDKRKEGVEIVRSRIFAEITDLFESKFGIKKEIIPEEFSRQDARAVEDMTLYLSNMNSPSAEKTNLVGYYLALQLHKTDGASDWERLRQGKICSPTDYLEPHIAESIENALTKSTKNNPIISENLGISGEERIANFRSDLQTDTETIKLGNIQTVDLRLQNLISNIEELKDPDLYPDSIDKEKITILTRYPAKTIGSTSAKMWQIANGRNINMNDEETRIAEDLRKLLSDHQIDMTPENIKTHLQDGFTTFKLPFAISEKVEKSGAREEIASLQASLTPPDSIQDIFKRLGEDFTPQSGVMALSQDIDYLENLIVKQEDELSSEEKQQVNQYLAELRNHMSNLEKIYQEITASFEKTSKSLNGSSNNKTAVVEKLQEIDRIIHNKNSESVITTVCTKDLLKISENMRACLSMKTGGCNNDTDLTFGESYKFYLYSHNDSNIEGSVSDEIVYFVPVGEDTTRHMGFVMDQVYGQKNSDILLSHVATVIKKAQLLKQRYNEAKISIVLPTSSLSSCGASMSADQLSQRVGNPELTFADIQNTKIVVPESGYGDHYIEFGGSARTAGERLVSGIEIMV